VARWLKGIDIRKYGSGNVGASNLMAQSNRKIGFALGVFDCVAKGTLPVVLCKEVLDQGPLIRATVGLVAVFGHNWSPYIRFTGGRGVATAIGAMVGFYMWQEFLLLGVFMGIMGWLLFKEMGFWTFMSMIGLPVLAFVFNRPTEIVFGCLGITLLLLAKRLTANWERPLSGHPWYVIFACRVVWDRDVPRKAEWLSRRPGAVVGGAADGAG
jgi:glycerol-3-phosphate acyltransferase PlsY